MAEHADGDEKCMKNISRKPEGKGPLGRRRSRWEFNVKIDLKNS